MRHVERAAALRGWSDLAGIMLGEGGLWLSCVRGKRLWWMCAPISWRMEEVAITAGWRNVGGVTEVLFRWGGLGRVPIRLGCVAIRPFVTDGEFGDERGCLTLSTGANRKPCFISALTQRFVYVQTARRH